MQIQCCTLRRLKAVILRLRFSSRAVAQRVSGRFLMAVARALSHVICDLWCTKLHCCVCALRVIQLPCQISLHQLVCFHQWSNHWHSILLILTAWLSNQLQTVRSSGLQRRVVRETLDVSEEHIPSMFRVEEQSKQESRRSRWRCVLEERENLN